MSNFSNLVVNSQLKGTRATPLSNVYQHPRNIVQSEFRVVPNDYLRNPMNNIKFSETDKVFTIPRGSLLGNTMLKITLKTANNAVVPPAGSALVAERGYGFLIPRRIQYKYGSSDPVQMSSRCNHLSVMRELDMSNQAREQMMNLAGKRRDENQVHVPPSSVPDGVWEEDVVYIPLCLPHSSWGTGTHPKVPFSSDILDGDVLITIDTATPEEVFSNNTAYRASGAQYPEMDMELVTMSFNMVDYMTDSIRQTVSRSGDDYYSYNFVYHGELCRTFAGADIVADPCGRSNVNLAGFKSGNTLGLSFLLLENGVDFAGTIDNAHLGYSEMENLIVNIDSNLLLKAKGDDIKIFDYVRSNLENNFPVLAGGTTATSSQISPWVDVAMSQYNKPCIDSDGQLDFGLNLSNRVVTLSFTTPKGDPTRYTLFVCQNVQSAIYTANGINKISFTDI